MDSKHGAGLGTYPVVHTPIGPQLAYLPAEELPTAPAPLPDYITASKSKEWYTPTALVDDVIKVLGGIYLDPAAPPPPYTEWVPADHHITEAMGTSLDTIWRGSVFLNPPYGRKIGLWVEKFTELYRLGYITEGIMLLPARTDTVWFEDVWSADALCFLRGRLKFEMPGKMDLPAKDKPGAPFPSVIAYYGTDWRSFAPVFAKWGEVIYTK